MSTEPLAVTDGMIEAFIKDPVSEYGDEVAVAVAQELRTHPEKWPERYKVLMDAVKTSRSHRAMRAMGNKPFVT